MTPTDGSLPEAPIDELERRVARLEDRAAIADLLERYTQALDRADSDVFVESYTADGSFEAHNLVTGAVTAQYGRDQLRAKIEGHTRPPELYHQHLVGRPLVTVDGDSATSISYFLLTVGLPADGMPQTVMFGRYLDSLQRGEGNLWRISDRRAEVGAFNPVWNELRDVHRRQME
jgi:hypothetical protein